MTAIERTLRILGHVLFWTFIIAFCNLLDWQWSLYTSENGNNTLFIPSLYGTLFNALLCYIHIFALYRVKAERPLYYVLGVMALLLGFSLLETLIDYHYIRHFINETFTETLAGMKAESNIESDFTLRAFLFAALYLDVLLVHAVFYVFSFAYLFPRQNLLNRRKQGQLEQEKLKTELQYLKAQINPHFLFNGINSIYHLIDDRPAMAKEVLLTFSALLRYQLYECQDELIPLERELHYLNNYLTLERVRKGDDASVRYELPETVAPELQIAPLLLSPFIENAFKYLSNHEDPERNRLTIDLRVQQKTLIFRIRNTFDIVIKGRDTKPGGIGLENVQKRLKLLYPHKHSLTIRSDDWTYSVELELELA